MKKPKKIILQRITIKINFERNVINKFNQLSATCGNTCFDKTTYVRFECTIEQNELKLTEFRIDFIKAICNYTRINELDLKAFIQYWLMCVKVRNLSKTERQINKTGLQKYNVTINHLDAAWVTGMSIQSLFTVNLT